MRPAVVRRCATTAATASECAAKPYSEVPGPRPAPMIGNTWRLLPLIGQFDISDVARVSQQLHDRYGRICKFSRLVGRPDLLFVYDCDEIERVYRNEGPTPFRPSMPCLVEYKNRVRKDLFGALPGVVGVHGEQWREFRTRVQQPILQPRTVRQYVAPIEAVTEHFIERMLHMLDERSELPVDFDNEIHKWSLECIGRVALDVRLGCLDPNLPADSEPQRIIDAAKYALRNVAILELKMPFWRYVPTPLWTKYVNNMDYFVSICMKYIELATYRLEVKRRGRDNGVGDGNSELSLMERILESEPDPKLASVLALDLILVGIDTISMAVCSILYQLATRPAEQQKLYEELRQALPNPDAPLDSTALDRMSYLRSFVREVFRMHTTVIGNGRTLQQNTVICGYMIPAGVQVVFPTLVTGNMERWVSRAAEFMPERWLKDSGERVHPFASLPYGHGARMCLGRRFAELEIQVILAKLIRRYRLEYHHEPLSYKVTFMYAPDGPLRFKMVKRDL